MGLAGLTGFGGFRMFGGGGLCPSIFIIGGIPLMACIATSSGSYGALSGKRVGAGKRARLFLIHCDTTNPVLQFYSLVVVQNTVLCADSNENLPISSPKHRLSTGSKMFWPGQVSMLMVLSPRHSMYQGVCSRPRKAFLPSGSPSQLGCSSSHTGQLAPVH